MYFLLSVYCILSVFAVSVSHFLQNANLISGIGALFGCAMSVAVCDVLAGKPC